MRRIAAVVMGSLMMGMLGCVSQADYDQVMMQNKTLAAEREDYAQRALAAESAAEAIRNQLVSKERELEIQKDLNGTLKAENDKIHEAFKRQQDIMAGIDLNPDQPLVIQTVLPPELDKALKEFAASHPNVEYDSSRGVVKWKADLLFASGSDVVREDAASNLRSFAEIINTPQAKPFDIVVVGYTDNDPILHSKGRHPTNWHLSTHRSIAVVNELMSAQTSPDRLGVMGYSEFRPIANNDTEEAKSQNRRVEIYLVSQGAPVNTAMQNSDAAAQPQPEVEEEPQK